LGALITLAMVNFGEVIWMTESTACKGVGKISLGPTRIELIVRWIYIAGWYPGQLTMGGGRVKYSDQYWARILHADSRGNRVQGTVRP